MKSASVADKWGIGLVTANRISRVTSRRMTGATNVENWDTGRENVSWTVLRISVKRNCSKSSAINATAAERLVTGRGIVNCRGTITDSVLNEGVHLLSNSIQEVEQGFLQDVRRIKLWWHNRLVQQFEHFDIYIPLCGGRLFC